MSIQKTVIENSHGFIVILNEVIPLVSIINIIYYESILKSYETSISFYI